MANKTKIEWCDYTINPIKGRCKTGCPYCYATRMYDRYKWDPTVRLDMSVFDGLERLPPSKIFVCSTHEIFGEWIPSAWLDRIFDAMMKYSSMHTFILLTKNPGRKYWHVGHGAVWVGTSITTRADMHRWVELRTNHLAAVNFVSFEPLHEDIGTVPPNADWIIIGSETGNRSGKVIAERSWLNRLIHSAAEWRVPYFVKNNALEIMLETPLGYQNWPAVKP